jgi:hypothetical protein
MAFLVRILSQLQIFKNFSRSKNFSRTFQELFKNFSRSIVVRRDFSNLTQKKKISHLPDQKTFFPMQTRSSQNTQEDRTLEGRFLAQLFELAPFLDDMTYKRSCDIALWIRNVRKSDAPHKWKREQMRLLTKMQSLLAKVRKQIAKREREALANEREATSIDR